MAFRVSVLLYDGRLYPPLISSGGGDDTTTPNTRKGHLVHLFAALKWLWFGVLVYPSSGFAGSNGLLFRDLELEAP